MLTRDPWPLPTSSAGWPPGTGQTMSRVEQIIRLDHLDEFVGPVCGSCAGEIARLPQLFPEVDHTRAGQVGSQRRQAQRCRAGHV